MWVPVARKVDQEAYDEDVAAGICGDPHGGIESIEDLVVGTDLEGSVHALAPELDAGRAIELGDDQVRLVVESKVGKATADEHVAVRVERKRVVARAVVREAA